MFVTGFCKPRLHCSHSLTHSFIHCPGFEHLFSTAHNSRYLGNEDIAHRPQKVPVLAKETGKQTGVHRPSIEFWSHPGWLCWGARRGLPEGAAI